PGFPRASRRSPSRIALGFAWTLLALTPVLIVSCGGGRAREIVFWQFWPAAVIQPLLDAFQKEHPLVQVRMEQLTWRSGPEKITAAMASGEVPDLCQIGSTWMPRMLCAGVLADWSAGIADLKPKLRGWPLCSIGDAAYGVPWVVV